MKHEKSCGTIIIGQNKVLIIGTRNDDGKLFWSFPKGHQEVGVTEFTPAIFEKIAKGHRLICG